MQTWNMAEDFRLVLHLGAQKSATTTIQHRLASHGLILTAAPEPTLPDPSLPGHPFPERPARLILAHEQEVKRDTT